MDGGDRDAAATAVGLCLLPSELLYEIFARLAEVHENRPVVYEYSSETGAWRSIAAVELPHGRRTGLLPHPDTVLLSITHHGSETVVVGADRESRHEPVVLRPRFAAGTAEGAELGDRLRVYGDGSMAILKSTTVTEETQRARVRTLVELELWGMNRDGREWELIARAPKELVERVGRPYCAMMGCLEEKAGVIRVVLMSNYNGLWDLIWVCYDKEKGEWGSVPVPDYGTKGLNMAGIAVTSSLGLHPAATARVRL